ncbi:H/ACA ribonucleoprotein complex, subunit Gar1/Naf1 [Moelleriella libera RCEF 2490]|uniref:H/ACA ribonucleoprotein complex non-core subunit NAF1 n=1 Tax=Moelleriella libera RCEF 2490 TaxID=1081109 RepID=A0A166RK75_9HYPO|nr:H/ACA ribonucleoprotein complex, subunit Gar1/Naf1 [Moelleriella libera RCEF 2490]
MSTFNIPGLGQAKPNETLPPLPADVLAAAASASAMDIQVDVANETKPAPDAAPEPQAPQQEKEAEPMKLDQDATVAAADQAGSPPSLTGALEAAIGGLGNPSHGLEQPQPQRPEDALQNDQGDSAEWEVDSSPYESSSESSSSDSSDEESDHEDYELLGAEETARLLMEAEGGSDDEGERTKGSTAAQLRTKNEVAQEVLPKPDITITEEMKIEELGSVENIVENIMLIKAITPGEYQVLDTGSVLCNAERTVIGVVAETIGKVLQPMYTVYFNSAAEIKELGLEIGHGIFYPVDHAHYVFTQPLKNLKGSDASNLHDEEIGDEEMEFSDDEKEAEYKRSLKQKKRDKWKSKNETGVGSGSRQGHPLSQEMSASSLNYDDDDDGPYKPLSRPPGFGSGAASTETYEAEPRPESRRGGGRGRGDGRRRGGRGRSSGREGARGGFNGPKRDGYSLPPQGASPAFLPQPPQQQVAPPPPTLPNFGVPFPGLLQPHANQSQHVSVPPPPPPGWPGQAQNPAGAYIDPTFLAALMSQMQQQSGQPPQPPPQQYGGHGR